ncbi:envelope stress sensor histidine kinase CpxA [Lonepinella sp. BR2930]|uniref:envelope stress sensor histidine kinase CpxA n=1 Tax=unclassified Lonepinella TaxID=2642006 RepID=UPI003F6DD96D
MKVTINFLSAKIFALFWCIFGLLLLAAYFVPQLDTRLYVDLTSKEIKKYHQDVVSAVKTRQFSRLLVTPEPFIEEKLNFTRPVLVDNERNIIGAKKNEIGYIQDFMHHSHDVLRPRSRTFYNLLVAGPFSIHLVDEDKQSAYFVYFITNVDPQKNIVNYIFDHPLFLIMLLMLISTPILAWLACSLTKPIRRLQRAANAVALGDFRVNKELETIGVVELRQVGKSFNHMAQSLADIINTRQYMMSVASHELRTPLTRLQLAVGLIRRKVGDSKELQRIEKETNRLNQMMNDLLLVSAAQMENSLYRKCISLLQVYQNVLNDAAFEAKELQIEMRIKQKIKSPEKCFIYANLEGLSRALENVIRNALKYTKSIIEVSFLLRNNQLFIMIDDNGQGLPESEYKHIFHPFYRVDEERTQIKQGAGLGLTIVHSTIKSHQGEVWAGKSHLGGLRIVIKLPLWQD